MSELTFTEREANKNAHDSRIEMLRSVDREEIRMQVRGLQIVGKLPKT